MNRSTVCTIILSIMLFTASSLTAFVPFIDSGRFDRVSANLSGGTVQPPMDMWVEFVERYGSDWHVEWDEETGTPRAIYGSSIEIVPGGISSGNFLADRLLSFVDENSGLLAVTSSDLQTLSSRRRGRFWYVNFEQIAGGVPVYGGYVQFRLRTDGKLVSISSRIHKGVGHISSPIVTVDRAEERSRREVSFAEEVDRMEETRLVVYPDRSHGSTRYRLSWMVKLITHAPPAHWFYVIDALTGDTVDRWNQIYYDDVRADSIFGRVRGEILPETPTDTPDTRSLKDLLVELNGGGSDVTSSAGLFVIETSGPGPDSILAELSGPFVNVNNDSSADAAIRTEATPGVPNAVNWDNTNSVVAERNGFYHTIAVHDYIKNIDASFTELDYSVSCRVNENQTCNAFWDGYGMNFFRAGGGCANTANIADVIYHEYGHGVTDYQYRPFPQPSGGMHEGLSDYLAATMTNQSLIGRGFTGPGSYIRNTENHRVWPAPECGGEPHCVGEAVAGALWDMRQNLVASMGQEAGVALSDSLFHYARYGLGTTLDDYFVDLLLVDDDDGDLSDGIPHAEEICGGFENHGLSCVNTPNAPIIFDEGNGTDMQLVWQPVPQMMAPIADYHVFLGEVSGVYTDSMSTGGDTTTVVTGLVEGTHYYFAVVAEDSTGQRSLPSQESQGTPLSEPTAPIGLSGESMRESISLSWLGNRELDIDVYVIHRSVSVDTGFSELATVPASDTTYVDQTPEQHVMYYYRVAARDTDGITGEFSRVARGKLMSLDSGLLVIDGTKDGSDGSPYSWSDSTVDNFYADLLADYPVAANFDIADSLESSLFPLDQASMAPYSTVVWHEDDRASSSIVPYLGDIGSYLSQGGSLFLCGWNLAEHLSGSTGGRVVFEDGSVPHDYLKMNSAEILPSMTQDFDGADAGVGGYPDLSVDSTKAFLFDGNLFEMDIIDEPLVDQPVTEPIYSYRSSDGDTAAYDGEIVGLRYLGGDYRLVLLDLPLFYVETPDAMLAMASVMDDLGEEVGIAGGGEPAGSLPRAFALHQNYPNPFNPSTSIVVDVPERSGDGGVSRVDTRVAIFSIRGRLVRVLFDGEKEPGRYLLHWDGRDSRGSKVGSGVYLYRMEAGDFVSTRKMVLLK